MPAASVCSHTTSPYHTIGGNEQTASAAQNRMTTAWFSDTMISKTNQTFKKNTTKITIRAEHVWSECRPRES